jgi:hypothetical protein|tara:strand:- start:366 stop:941 length:576 start_codon:yes stop_codon:yes gene_type:complete
MLKKEFKKKDVNRLRNLITGKTGESTSTQIGYNKKIEDYKEGDIWTENKKTWTIKNGIKQTVSKLDKVRKETFMPLCCPKCNNIMKSQLDKPNYKIHKMCHNCVVDFEASLKNKGLFKEYIKKLKGNNAITSLNEMESYLLDAINTSNSSFISEQGEIERWVGGFDKKKYKKDIKTLTKQAKERVKKQLDD